MAVSASAGKPQTDKAATGEFVHFFSSFKSLFKVTLISESPADCELCAEISFLSAKT